jgi:ketosteroid isomerase-like protein
MHATVSVADLEVVRQLFTFWERGEFRHPEFFDPDVVYAPVASDFPEFTGNTGDWQSREEMERASLLYLQSWDELRYKAEELIDLGDRVLVLSRQSGRGRKSGVPLDKELAEMFTLRDGKIVRWETYWDRGEALRVAGVQRLTPDA